MAKGVKKAEPTELTIGLFDPGMTPLLRAGLGGIAAALRAIHLEKRPRASWPTPEIPLDKGIAIVEKDRLRLSWTTGNAGLVLKTLFDESFRLTNTYGVSLIDLLGTYEVTRPLSPVVSHALQRALKRTFLQHGKTTQKAGSPTTITVEIDGRPYVIAIQGYAAYAQQSAWEEVVAALKTGTARLASWAYPGAVRRHNKFPETEWDYSAAQVLCGCFAVTGCLSLNTRVGGVLVILEPSDLQSFAWLRSMLTPKNLTETEVAGVGDAVLAVNLALRLNDSRRNRHGIVQTHGVALRTTPWAKQLKSRVMTLSTGEVSDAVLDAYADLTAVLPSRIRERFSDDIEDEGDAEFFVTTSEFRGFVAENLAAGRRWYRGFALAKTEGKTPRFIHYYRAEKNLGALFMEEQEGLIKMLDHLEQAEKALVISVHVALRQRFGAIAEESRDNPVGMKKRFDGEREKWRLKFCGAKTSEQTRAALADLWSRGGVNKELQMRWREVLPLLRSDNWEAARDLALIALASYRGAESEGENDREVA